MKTTPLTQVHIDLGARMAEFAGYNMPITYSSITEEHEAVRKSIGMFDVSHMGQFIVKGKEALNLVQKISSNDASKLKLGQAQYSCIPNDKGGVVDDFIVYRLAEDQCDDGEQAYLLVVNASNIEKDFNWIKEANTFDTRIIDISDETILLAVQGPKAVEALQSITDVDLSAISFYHFEKGSIGGVDNVIISATGYTGSGGFELYANKKYAVQLWDACMEAGSKFEIKACGLGARDTLRLEMGYCLYGHEINDDISPISAGLGWIVKTKKADDFFSKENFIADRKEGTAQKLVGIEVLDRRVPRQGYPILDEGGNEIGIVTSGTMSPSRNIPIAMGFVNKSFAEIGTKVLIQIRKKTIEGSVVKPPFVKI